MNEQKKKLRFRDATFPIAYLAISTLLVMAGGRFGLYPLMKFSEKQREETKIERVNSRAQKIGLTSKIDEISRIFEGDKNNDGNRDYVVFYKDGREEIYFHQGWERK